MGNYLGRLIARAYEVIDWLNVRRSLPTPDQTAGSHMVASEECAPSEDEGALGGRGSAGSSSEQKPECMSVRAEAMMRSRSEFSSDADYEIEHSRVHWSELADLADGDDELSEKDVILENLLVFSKLKADPRWMRPEWGPFFKTFISSKALGQKIAEGGQAGICEFLGGDLEDRILMKVFMKGSRISQLSQQWQSTVLQRQRNFPQIVIHGLLIIDDGRFAFGMIKCWGDLSKLIDQAMEAKNNQGPPFPFEWNGVIMHALDIMKEIAKGMKLLHAKSIVHRDMKAFNVLLLKELSYPYVVVAAYECSIGVVGTTFWRAPEILLGLKSLKSRGAIDFSEKVDVYAYGMTCFEILTGLLPYEGELVACPTSYDLVIGGRRPTLPRDLDVALKRLIKRCWDPNPLERPSFSEICRIFSSMFQCCCDGKVVDANVVAKKTILLIISL